MNKNKNGFTLVELVIVIAVIAILSAVLIPTFAGIIDRARENTLYQQAVSARDEIVSKEFNSVEEINGFIISVDDTLYQVKDGGLIEKINNNLSDFQIISGTQYAEMENVGMENNIVIYRPDGEIIVSGGKNNERTFTWQELKDNDYLYVEDGVLYINEIAKELISINIDAEVEVISSYAFYYCTNLLNVNIPDSVVQIDESAFESSAINEVEIPSSVKTIGNSAFSNTNIVKIVVPENVTSMGYNMFYGCSNLENATIDAQVTKISSAMFYNCYNLKNVTLPNTVTEIEGCAFYGCSSLKNISIPDSVTVIGGEVFKDCSSLEFYTYENGKYLGNSTHNYIIYMSTIDAQLTEATFHEQTKFIYDYAFNSTSLTKIKINDNIVGIGERAFEYCYSLLEIEIGSGLKSMGLYPFGWCTNVESIKVVSNEKYDSRNDCNALIETQTNTILYGCKNTVIPSTVVEIKEFLNAPENLVIPGNIKTIDGFYNVGLKSVVLQEGVEHIGFQAFANNPELETVVLADSITYFEELAFEDCDGLELTLYNNAYYLPSTTNPYFFLLKAESEDITSCVVHSDTKYFELYAFKNCESLETITFPETAKNFPILSDLVSLKSATVPVGVTILHYMTFYNCVSLESVVIPSTVKQISGMAFNGCKSLTSIELPQNCESLGHAVLGNCVNLNTVTYYKNLYADTSTFENCENIVTVNFHGTEEEFYQVGMSHYFVNNENVTINFIDD